MSRPFWFGQSFRNFFKERPKEAKGEGSKSGCPVPSDSDSLEETSLGHFDLEDLMKYTTRAHGRSSGIGCHEISVFIRLCCSRELVMHAFDAGSHLFEFIHTGDSSDVMFIHEDQIFDAPRSVGGCERSSIRMIIAVIYATVFNDALVRFYVYNAIGNTFTSNAYYIRINYLDYRVIALGGHA